MCCFRRPKIMVDDSSEVEDRETVMYTKNSRFKSFFKKKKMIHDEPLDSRDKIKDETIEYSCQKEEYKNWHDNLKDIQREKDELENKEVKDDFGELIGVNSKIEELEAGIGIVSNFTQITPKITRLLVTLPENSSKPCYSLLTLTWIEKNDDYSLLL